MDYSTDRILLNHQIFMEKLLADPNFFLEIITWKGKLQLSNSDLGNFFNSKKNCKKARLYGIELMEKILKKKDYEFIYWLNDFCKKYQLSDVWQQSLIDFIACGYYCPPTTAISVTADKEQGFVILKIGADASKKDFAHTWNEVKKAQKVLPMKTRRRLSKKSFSNLEKVLNANKLRAEGLKGLDIIAHLYEEVDDESKEADKKRLRNLKIIQQRTKKRGYNKNS